MFNPRLATLALLIGLTLTLNGRAQVSVTYDSGSGNLSVASDGRAITSFEAKSAGNLFVPANIAAGVLAPPFDLITPAKLFRLSAGTDAYNSIDFGNILPAELSNSQLHTDLTIAGSLSPVELGADSNNAISADGLHLSWSPSPVNVIYDSTTGNLSVESTYRSITTFEIKSANNLFIPENIVPGIITRSFDIIRPDKLFKLSPQEESYNNLDFGNIVTPGLTREQFIADMTIDGSLLLDNSSRHSLAFHGLEVNHVIIPEPSSVMLLSLGLLSWFGGRRKRGNSTT